ncbi:ParB/RepB/Spo0J family partition protein [Brevibacterium luteolum]|uniref:ParB/RepB/Spo0J family partition protein n=1 Tax=Brevibacterium luteolum TaxID=199591 RepID=A0A849AS60_9MICO|nr:ParB/RepB/Spo0J family partition protein [Brevibacterium luteolum]MBM7530013.1 ParB family chromosome partitioning protein [Brevibacterium luteolum]MCT1920474.1 ParB/RepB/Spo0J family partition protein [Brevibacterium luteolum]NNG78765.1 ParB/RepB/Spo0J family partition protein [Brevibacterium luteolum]
MAERKRGLGRGLGALIPDVVTDERPVDVFFGQQGEQETDVSRETPRSKDPAEGMRKARAAKRTSAKPAKKGSSPAVKNSAPTAAKKTQRADSKGAPTKKSTVIPSESGTDSVTLGTSDVSRETVLQEVPGTAFGLIPLEQISPNPRQPRQVFDEDALDELVQSIREVGVLQPVVVRLVDEKKPSYELIMGERRFRASELAGTTTIPAIIRAVEDTELLRDALLENLHRSDLNPLEEAAAYEQLLSDFQCTQEELSERIGRSRPQISNTLRLLRLPPLVQRRVAAGVISQGHARAILGVEDPANMEVLAQRIVAEGLSVRATEEAVVLLNRGEKPRVSRETKQLSPELAQIADRVGDKLDTRVNIVMGKRKGRISVEFANQDDLKRILTALGIEDEA